MTRRLTMRASWLKPIALALVLLGGGLSSAQA